MTRFGRGFPYLNPDCVGNLLVLIPERLDRFLMYVLDLEEDIEEIQAALGVFITDRWAVFERGAAAPEETEGDCIDRNFRRFAEPLHAFPPTIEFARGAYEGLVECVRGFVGRPCDDKLMLCVEAEYRLFRLVERKVCEPDIVRLFQSVDDFLSTAQSILQRRKSRAGKSLEHHVGRLLREAEIPFEPGQDVDGTKPDILIPGKAAYLDPAFPVARLFAVGLKTTCKDRWRQVTREAPRVMNKHILTLQRGISSAQLDQMAEYSVALVVPRRLHDDYPPDRRGKLLTLEGFIGTVRTALSA